MRENIAFGFIHVAPEIPKAHPNRNVEAVIVAWEPGRGQRTCALWQLATKTGRASGTIQAEARRRADGKDSPVGSSLVA